jgi:ABC-2 type transport system ATP-binding protein
MIMSILFRTRGRCRCWAARSALEAKDQIGYLPEERGVYRKMRVGAFLTYLAQLKGVSREVAAARVPALLEQVGLRGTERTACDELSKGMLQRVQFVGATLHEPELLILDEPFSGLDPVSVRLLREQVRNAHARGATILLSTHIMAYAEEMCDHVFMIHEGRKVLDQPMEGLRRQFDPRTLVIEPLDPQADLAPIRTMPEVERIEPQGSGYALTLAAGVDTSAVLARARRAGAAGADRDRAPPARGRVRAHRRRGRRLDEAAAALRSRLQAGAAEEARV